MAPKKLPSFCGLPISWHPDMEVRLGYWEARDETRDFKDVLRILKRDFPDLADYAVTVESLLQWIEWLDWQEGPRGDSYRAGITLGQLSAQQAIHARSLDLGSIDVAQHTEPNPVNTSKAYASKGIRLVENDSDTTNESFSAAGGLQSVTTSKSSPKSSHTTPTSIYYTATHTRGNTLPAIPTTPTSGATRRVPSRGIDINILGPATTTKEEIYRIRRLGDSSNTSPSDASMTQSTSRPTTSVSLHVPDSASRSSYPKSNTPATVASPSRSVSNDSNNSPRRSVSAHNHSTSASPRLVSPSNIAEIPPRNMSSPNADASTSSGSGLRERRRLNELHVAIAASGHPLGALPQIRAKENEQSSVKSIVSSVGRPSFKDRVKARLAYN